MRYNAYGRQEREEKTVFLILPRYCSNCKIGIVWERIKKVREANSNYWVERCPVCNKIIWSIK